MMLSIFLYAYWPLVYILWRYDYFLCTFLNGLLFYCGVIGFFIYFAQKSLFRYIIWKCFFHFVDYFCTYLIFTFDKVKFINFSLLEHAFGVILKKQQQPHANPRSCRFLPLFPSENFIVLALTCRSLIHYMLIFIHGMRQRSKCNLLDVEAYLI